MKIAVGSDMDTFLTKVVVEELQKMGHEVKLFGAFLETPALWSKVAIEVARKVSDGTFDQAVLFCWTGTGIAIAANKVPGIRAALCQDAETARGARKWNNANVLAMSLRVMSEHIAKEILHAWFETEPSTDQEDVDSLDYLQQMDGNL